MFSKMTQDRAAAKEGQEHLTHSDYVLQLLACNNQRRKFYECDLPEALDAAQAQYVAAIGEMTKSIEAYANNTATSHVNMSQLQHALITSSQSGMAITWWDQCGWQAFLKMPIAQ